MLSVRECLYDKEAAAVLYKVVVVDDEVAIRNGIAKFINRFSDDFEVTKVLEDGRDTIAYLSAHRADLIISDIKMSDIDGIELCKYIHEHFPDTKMIVLSGYSNFDYAQQLMKSGVSLYLLKPLDKAKLLEALSKVKSELDEKAYIAKQIEKHNIFINELKRIFFVDMIFGGFTDENSPMHRMALSEFDNPDEKYCSVLKISLPPELDEYLKCSEKNAYSFISSFFALNDEKSFCTYLDDDLFAVVSDDDNINFLIDALKAWGMDTCKNDISVSVVYSCRGLLNLRNYSSGIASSSDDANTTQRLMLIISYICYHMTNEAVSLFSIFTKKSNLTSSDIFNLLCGKIGDSYHMNPSKYISAAEKSDGGSIEAFKSFIGDYYALSKDKNDLIIKIKTYISQNYMNNISLEVLSKVVYMHPAYLSHFFKQETGINFSDYLFDVRMLNATKLLSENKYKINEISRLVGYNNYRYFLKQFKKYTSYTPHAYRKIMWIDDSAKD